MPLGWLKKFMPRVAPYGDVGQTFFVVTSTTEAEWDTGLPALYNTTYRGPSGKRVFHTRDYSTHQLTVQSAVTATVANRGDIIFITPGTYTPSAANETIGLTKAGVRVMGPPVKNPKRAAVVFNSRTNASNEAIFTVSAANVELSHMQLTPHNGRRAVAIGEGGDGFYAHDLLLDMASGTASVQTIGIISTGAPKDGLIERIYVENSGANGPAFVFTTSSDFQLRDCDLVHQSGVWASAVNVGPNTVRLSILGNRFRTSGVAARATVGIHAGLNTIIKGTFIADNRFDTDYVTAISGFLTSGAQLAENYQTGNLTASGGTLITNSA